MRRLPERRLKPVPAPAAGWRLARCNPPGRRSDALSGQGDISDCFGSFDHEILLRILAERIHDQRFLRLIRHMLKAGYLEDWDYHETLSGCPQGGVVSPTLSNIYLDKLDEFIEQELIPQYTRGEVRAANPAYRQADALLRRARRR